MEAESAAVDFSPFHSEHHPDRGDEPSGPRLRLEPRRESVVPGDFAAHCGATEEGLSVFWQDLTRGRWQLMETLDASRWRYLIVGPPQAPKPLSDRERHVLERVIRSQIDKVIAYDMGLSVSTVATHRAQAIHKLGLGSQLLTMQVAHAAFATPDCECSQITVLAVGGARPRRVVRIPYLAERLPERLTPAERRVLAQLLAGNSNRAIARERGVSERTVANQIASGFHRLGVTRRHELVAKLCECGDGCTTRTAIGASRGRSGEPRI